MALDAAYLTNRLAVVLSSNQGNLDDSSTLQVADLHTQDRLSSSSLIGGYMRTFAVAPSQPHTHHRTFLRWPCRACKRGVRRPGLRGLRSQQAAQLFFLNNNPAADPHGLDADGDGVVCESNPGPYYYGSNPNPGGNNNPQPQPPKPPKAKPAPIKVVKVIKGDLVRLRQGSAKPYDVRLIGLKVAGNSCMTSGARDYLKDRREAGPSRHGPHRQQGARSATAAATSSPRSDPRAATPSPGFSRKVVTEGWAKVQGYKFGEKKNYERLMGSADYWRVGLFGDCIKDYGSARYPYRVGTTFEVDGWRYTFGATDFDALPEMTAEAAAANATAPGSYAFTPPKAGTTLRRIPVTATRLDGRSPQYPVFGHVYGDEADEVSYDRYGSCGTAPNLLDQMTVSPGQTVSAYLCTVKPTPGEHRRDVGHRRPGLRNPEVHRLLSHRVPQDRNEPCHSRFEVGVGSFARP